MERKFAKTVEVGGVELDGEFTHNSHGYFCEELNGVLWDYVKSAQAASSTPEEAARKLWEMFGAEEDE